MHWDVIDTGLEDACRIMDKDRLLFEDGEERASPVLHFYEWEGPSATYGRFIDPSLFFSGEGMKQTGLRIAKRPTGGGIIFHLWDFAFSAFVPSSHPGYSDNILANYAFINNRILAAVQDFLGEIPRLLPGDEETLRGGAFDRFCMATPTKYDVVLEGKKIAGAAQRKTKNGFLHQGTVSLLLPSEQFLRSVLLPVPGLIEAIRSCSFPLFGEGGSEIDLSKKRSRLKHLILQHFTRDDL